MNIHIVSSVRKPIIGDAPSGDPAELNVDGCTPLMAAVRVGARAVDEEAGIAEEVVEAIK